MEKTVGDAGVGLVRAGCVLKPLAPQCNAFGQTGLLHGPFGQLHHRRGGINPGDATGWQRTGESNGDIARTTADINYVALLEIGKVFTEAVNEPLILLREIRRCIGLRLFWIIHQFRFEYTIHSNASHISTQTSAISLRLVGPESLEFS